MASLWSGRDHLVYVRGSGFLLPFTEEYKRYRFEDIQAFAVVRRSRVGLALVHGFGVIFWFGLVALILGLADVESFGTGSGIFVSILALGGLVSLSLLVRHLILGSPCFCDIQTSLSHDRLRSLDRYHLAREVIDRLESGIRERQDSVLESEGSTEVSAGGDESPEKSNPFSVPWPVFPGFGLAALFGLGGLVAIHVEMLGLVIAQVILFLLVSLFLTLSLVASVRRATPQAIRSWLWGLLGLLFVFSGVAVVYLFLTAARDPAYTLEVTGPLEAFMAVATEGGPIFYFLFLGVLGATALCGAIGGIHAVGWLQKLATPRHREPDPEVIDG